MKFNNPVPVISTGTKLSTSVVDFEITEKKAVVGDLVKQEITRVNVDNYSDIGDGFIYESGNDAVSIEDDIFVYTSLHFRKYNTITGVWTNLSMPENMGVITGYVSMTTCYGYAPWDDRVLLKFIFMTTKNKLYRYDVYTNTWLLVFKSGTIGDIGAPACSLSYNNMYLLHGIKSGDSYAKFLTIPLLNVCTTSSTLTDAVAYVHSTTEPCRTWYAESPGKAFIVPNTSIIVVKFDLDVFRLYNANNNNDNPFITANSNIMGGDIRAHSTRHTTLLDGLFYSAGILNNSVEGYSLRIFDPLTGMYTVSDILEVENDAFTSISTMMVTVKGELYLLYPSSDSMSLDGSTLAVMKVKPKQTLYGGWSDGDTPYPVECFGMMNAYNPDANEVLFVGGVNKKREFVPYVYKLDLNTKKYTLVKTLTTSECGAGGDMVYIGNGTYAIHMGHMSTFPDIGTSNTKGKFKFYKNGVFTDKAKPASSLMNVKLHYDSALNSDKIFITHAMNINGITHASLMVYTISTNSWTVLSDTEADSTENVSYVPFKHSTYNSYLYLLNTHGSISGANIRAIDPSTNKWDPVFAGPASWNFTKPEIKTIPYTTKGGILAYPLNIDSKTYSGSKLPAFMNTTNIPLSGNRNLLLSTGCQYNILLFSQDNEVKVTNKSNRTSVPATTYAYYRSQIQPLRYTFSNAEALMTSPSYRRYLYGMTKPLLINGKIHVFSKYDTDDHGHKILDIDGPHVPKMKRLEGAGTYTNNSNPATHCASRKYIYELQSYTKIFRRFDTKTKTWEILSPFIGSTKGKVGMVAQKKVSYSTSGWNITDLISIHVLSMHAINLGESESLAIPKYFIYDEDGNSWSEKTMDVSQLTGTYKGISSANFFKGGGVLGFHRFKYNSYSSPVAISKSFYIQTSEFANNPPVVLKTATTVNPLYDTNGAEYPIIIKNFGDGFISTGANLPLVQTMLDLKSRYSQTGITKTAAGLRHNHLGELGRNLYTSRDNYGFLSGRLAGSGMYNDTNSYCAIQQGPMLFQSSSTSNEYLVNQNTVRTGGKDVVLSDIKITYNDKVYNMQPMSYGDGHMTAVTVYDKIYIIGGQLDLFRVGDSGNEYVTIPNNDIFVISLDIGEEKTGSMYYTTDGSNPINEAGEPTANSAKYTDKTSIKLPAFIKCAYVED